MGNHENSMNHANSGKGAENNIEKKALLTRKDVSGAWAKFMLIGEITHSYERMIAITLVSAIGNCLKKIYGDDKERFSRALQRHMVFFNTEGNWGGAVMGMTIAMEEKMADYPEDEKDEAINSMKTSLMGPLAGIGDAIDWGTLKPIILGIGLSIAITGNVFGFLVCLIFNVLLHFIGYKCWMFGYDAGAAAMGTLLSGAWFKQFVRCASMLGILMMGALTASYVSLATPLTITSGEAVVSIQEVIDGIIPGLLPLAAVGGIYLIMRNKTQKFGLIAIGIVIICILLSLIGVV